LSSSARISATSAGSRDATPRLTLLSSAPMAQVSGSTLIESGSDAARTTAGGWVVVMVIALVSLGAGW
jgi:hypothetical protein